MDVIITPRFVEKCKNQLVPSFVSSGGEWPFEGDYGGLGAYSDSRNTTLKHFNPSDKLNTILKAGVEYHRFRLEINNPFILVENCMVLDKHITVTLLSTMYFLIA